MVHLIALRGWSRECSSLVMNKIVVHIRELYLVLQILVRNWIIPACYLQVVANRWWNHELEIVATKFIL